MALKAVIEKLEDVPEALRGEYVANADGKSYRLAVDGVEDVTGLKNTLSKVRDEADTARKALKAFEGLDAAEVRKMMAVIASSAEAKLIAEGKVDEVIQKRTERMQADFDGKLKQAGEQTEAAIKRAAGLQGKLVDAALREAAVISGVHSYALDDVLAYGRSLFTLDDNANVVMQKDGNTIMGKDGKTPLTAREWVETLREPKPHYFPAAGGGGGGRQSQQSGGGGKNVMKRSVYESLGPAERAAHFKDGGTLIDG